MSTSAWKPTGWSEADVRADEAIAQANGEIARFRSNKYWPHKLEVTTAPALVVVGVLIPSIAAADIAEKDSILFVLGLSVAIIAGLRAYFRWDVTWKGNALAEQAIHYRIQGFRQQRLKAQGMATEGEATDALLAATDRFVKAVEGVAQVEATTFFQAREAATTAVDSDTAPV